MPVILVPALLVLLLFVMVIVFVMLVGQRRRNGHSGNQEGSSEQHYDQFDARITLRRAAIGLHDVLWGRSPAVKSMRHDYLLACRGRFSCFANTVSAVFF